MSEEAEDACKIISKCNNKKKNIELKYITLFFLKVRKVTFQEFSFC